MTVPFTFSTATSPIPLANLDSNFAAVGDSQNVTYTPPFTNGVAETVKAKLAQIVSVMDFGGDPTGVTDSATAILNALAALPNGGVVTFPAGIFSCGLTISIPDKCSLQGSGQFATTLQLRASANVNLLMSASGLGTGIGIYDMTLDGNQANNTQGGVWLVGSSSTRGPTFQIERVRITHFQNAVSTTGIKSAFFIGGSDWCVIRDVDVINNDYCMTAMWLGCPDSQIDGLYLGTNCRSSTLGTYSSGLFINGSGNLFSNCYFGGTQKGSQLYFQGAGSGLASLNRFVNCIVDNSGGNGVTFDSTANLNQFVNCQIGNSSYSDGGTYYCVANIAGAGYGATFINTLIYSNYGAAPAAYGYYELNYTACNSQFIGGGFSGTFTGGPVALGSGSTTTFLGCSGYAYSNLSVIKQTLYTVATLPTAFAGATAFVSDATTTTFASLVVGGGSHPVPVYSDGTHWYIG